MKVIGLRQPCITHSRLVKEMYPHTPKKEKWPMKKIIINGMECVLSKRFSEILPPQYPYKYCVRHAFGDSQIPLSIEPFRKFSFGFYGVICSMEPIPMKRFSSGSQTYEYAEITSCVVVSEGDDIVRSEAVHAQ